MQKLTCHTGKQLPSEELNMRIGKRRECVAFEEIKDTLAIEICNNADVIPEIETMPQVNALIPVSFIVLSQCR